MLPPEDVDFYAASAPEDVGFKWVQLPEALF